MILKKENSFFNKRPELSGRLKCFDKTVDFLFVFCYNRIKKYGNRGKLNEKVFK